MSSWTPLFIWGGARACQAGTPHASGRASTRERGLRGSWHTHASRNTRSRSNPAGPTRLYYNGGSHPSLLRYVSCNQRVSWPFASVLKSESKLGSLAFWGLFNFKCAFSFLSGTLFLPQRKKCLEENQSPVKISQHLTFFVKIVWTIERDNDETQFSVGGHSVTADKRNPLPAVQPKENRWWRGCCGQCQWTINQEPCEWRGWGIDVDPGPGKFLIIVNVIRSTIINLNGRCVWGGLP